MTEFKGRHLGFLAILCGTWIATRVATNFIPAEPGVAAAKTVAAVAHPIRPAQAFSERLPHSAAHPPVCCVPSRASLQPHHWHRMNHLSSSVSLARPMPARASTPPAPAALPANPFLLAVTPEPTPERRLTANFYGYSFWRFQAPGQRLALGGQYGGSQSGLIATVGLARNAPALLLRTAVAHDNLRDREFAIGARWQPKANLPVSVTAERRFRGVGPDSFALYVAGGRGDMSLPARFKLETYVQAGVVSGNGSGYFFDAHARADRQILPQAPLPIQVGAGVWTGGQRGNQRLDIGPSLRTEIPVGDTRIQLTADWRFRVAGDAAPGNGPALTLSTGF